MTSPYHAVPIERWKRLTRKLVDQHPLDPKEIVDVVLSAWHSIFSSNLGTKGFRVGKQIFPKPQIMGFFLHELIPLELSARYPKEWRPERNAGDKDIVYIPDDTYSIEIKTSSNRCHIYGNRSYAQEATSNKKKKSGYYLAVNFQKFTEKNHKPQILLLRFGWLDAEDWIGQAAATGQQSRLSAEIEQLKLLQLYP